MSLFQLLKPNQPVLWSNSQKFLLKFFLFFFGLLILPLDWKYYRDLLSMDWSGFNYGVWFEISKYFPRFLDNSPHLGDLILVFLLAGMAAWFTHQYGKKSLNDDKLYYPLRGVVRYRLAIALLAYGYIKLFPIQAPDPSLTLLNTPYGDLSAWKIFHLSLGIVPDYQAFIGLFEILAALLLFHRKTASTGAFIALLILGNVFMSNLAYEGGEYVYSAALCAMGLFIFAHDLPRFYSLLYLRQKTVPDRFRGFYTPSALSKGIWLTSRAAILFWVFGYGVLVYLGYSDGLSKYPQTAGIKEFSGVYDVTLFVQEGDTIAYGLEHPDRWKKVVFEEWNTLSIQSNRASAHFETKVEYVATDDAARRFELEGIQGWQFYSYQWDEATRRILMENRHPDGVDIKLELLLTQQEDGQVALHGKDEEGKSIHALLRRLDKKYLLEEAAKQGRRARILL